MSDMITNHPLLILTPMIRQEKETKEELSKIAAKAQKASMAVAMDFLDSWILWLVCYPWSSPGDRSYSHPFKWDDDPWNTTFWT